MPLQFVATVFAHPCMSSHAQHATPFWDDFHFFCCCHKLPQLMHALAMPQPCFILFHMLRLCKEWHTQVSCMKNELSCHACHLLKEHAYIYIPTAYGIQSLLLRRMLLCFIQHMHMLLAGLYGTEHNFILRLAMPCMPLLYIYMLLQACYAACLGILFVVVVTIVLHCLSSPFSVTHMLLLLAACLFSAISMHRLIHLPYGTWHICSHVMPYIAVLFLMRQDILPLSNAHAMFGEV